MTTVEEDLDQASPLPPLPPASNFGRSLRKVRKGDGFNETGRKSCSTACAGKLGALRNTSLIACFDGASTVSLAYLKRERGERQKALPPPPSSIFSKCHFASSSCYETQPTNFCPFSSLLICNLLTPPPPPPPGTLPTPSAPFSCHPRLAQANQTTIAGVPRIRIQDRHE